MNNMSLWYIFHVAFHVTFFSLFLVLQVFFFINLIAIIKMAMSDVPTRVLFHPHMLFQPLFIRVCSVALITTKLWFCTAKVKNRNHDCIPKFLSIFSILSRLSFLYWLSCSFIDIHCFFRSVTNLHSYSGCSSPLPSSSVF